MSAKVTPLADRLEAMLHQVGHPDYSLGDFYGWGEAHCS